MADTPNPFKQALREGRTQIGLWVALADAYAAEMLANTGFDWLLIDGEHAPNDLRGMLGQLQAIAPYPTHAALRPACGDTVLIKQLLEIGAQTLLVPMVDSASQAAQVVAATRYPPRGVRGVGSAIARSARWNEIDDYLQRADDSLCVLVQVESARAMGDLAAITAVDGVDGVFFGPSDLAASMGHLGHAEHPEVQRAIEIGIAHVRAAGKAPGILATDPAAARRWLALGAQFVAVGVDTMLLMTAAKRLAASFKAGDKPSPAGTAGC